MRLIHAILETQPSTKLMSYSILGEDAEYITVPSDNADAVVETLDENNTDPLIFLSPIVIPLRAPDMRLIDDFVEVLQENEDLEYIRLCKCGHERDQPVAYASNLYEDNSNNFMHVPYLIREKSLYQILTSVSLSSHLKELYWFSLDTYKRSGLYYFRASDNDGVELPFYNSAAFNAVSHVIKDDGTWSLPCCNHPVLKQLAVRNNLVLNPAQEDNE